MYFCLKSAYSGQTNTKWYSSSRSFMSQNVHLRSFRSNLLFEYRPVSINNLCDERRKRYKAARLLMGRISRYFSN